MGWRLLFAAGIVGGAAIAIWQATRVTSLAFSGRNESAAAMPDGWWTKEAPSSAKLCYTTKTDALNVFREYNQAVIDDYGGESAVHRTSDFDAINHRHGLRGKQKANTIAKALWLAMPPERPYCLDKIDLDALNETAPGKEHPVGFMVPDFVHDLIAEKMEQDLYSRWQEESSPAPF